VEDLPIRILSDARADYYRGDLLLHHREFDAAEVYLRNAIRLDGESGDAYAALGKLQTERNLFKQARESLDRALGLGPKSPLAHYYSALHLRKEAAAGVGTLSHRDVERAANSELKRTVGFAPDFVEAAELLARSNLTLNRELDTSRRLLMESLKRSPGRPTLMMALAEVAAATGDKSSAAWILQRLISSGAGDTELAQEA